MQGVIDRIEDEIAVILIEEKKQEWTIHESKLPAQSGAGTILQLKETEEGFEIIAIDEEATQKAAAKANMLQKKLKAKKKRSKFKRDS